MAVSRMRDEKNVQYNPYLRPNCRNFRILEVIGVDGIWGKYNVPQNVFLVLHKS